MSSLVKIISELGTGNIILCKQHFLVKKKHHYNPYCPPPTQTFQNFEKIKSNHCSSQVL